MWHRHSVWDLLNLFLHLCCVRRWKTPNLNIFYVKVFSGRFAQFSLFIGIPILWYIAFLENFLVNPYSKFIHIYTSKTNSNLYLWMISESIIHIDIFLSILTIICKESSETRSILKNIAIFVTKIFGLIYPLTISKGS